MKRILPILLLLVAPLCRAQNLTTVTSTVKDPSGTAYSFGAFTVSLLNTSTQAAQFGGNSNFQTTYSGSLDTSGNLSIVLPSNAVITPSGTQWNFYICANPKQIAAVFPVPALPCFNSAQTISGSSQAITFTAASIPLPNGSSNSSGVPQGTLDATSATYGFKWDALAVTDLTTTNSSGAVSSPTAVWSAADIGKVFYAFAICNTGTVPNAQTPLIARTTITGFTNSHSITVGANASANSAANACGYWGTPDDAAAILLDAAAAASTTCPIIILPAKNTIFEKGHWNVSIPACNVLPGGLGGVLEGYGEVIQGQGKGNTRVFISPNLSLVNSTTCNGGASITDCFGGQSGQVFKSFQFDGGGFDGTAFGSAKNIVELATYSRAEDMAWYNYASSDTNATFKMTAVGTVHLVLSDIIRFGNTVSTGGGGVFFFQNADIQDLCGSKVVTISTIATINSSGSAYSAGPCNANNTHIVDVGGRFISNNDLIFNDTSANTFQGIVVSAATGVADLTGLTALPAGSTNFLPIDNAVSGAVTTCRGCNLIGGSATVSVFGVAGSIFYDGGNNKLPQGYTAGTPVITIQSSFTAPVLTGTGACATITTQSGTLAGKATCTGTTGASTLVITPGTTAPNGWQCDASDITTANTLRQSTVSQTACTIAGTINQNDVITFKAKDF